MKEIIKRINPIIGLMIPKITRRILQTLNPILSPSKCGIEINQSPQSKKRTLVRMSGHTFYLKAGNWYIVGLLPTTLGT